MTATFFPLAALFIDVLIIIMFYSKKTVKNKETKLFSILIFVNLIECIFDIIGICYIRNNGNIEIFEQKNFEGLLSYIQEQRQDKTQLYKYEPSAVKYKMLMFRQSSELLAACGLKLPSCILCGP